MAKVSLLTSNPKTSFQNFILAICHWEMNPDQDAHQTLIKKFSENW